MCDCYDGIIGDDPHGPLFCEKCPTGLHLGMADCERIADRLAEAKQGYGDPKTSTYYKEMHKQCQDAIIRLASESLRLQALYNAMTQPDLVLAWQERPDQVREEVASMAVLQEARA